MVVTKIDCWFWDKIICKITLSPSKLNSFFFLLQSPVICFGFPEKKSRKHQPSKKAVFYWNDPFQFTSQPLVSSSNQLKSARRVVDMHSFVKGIKMWRRHVEVSHGESPLLVLTMQHQTKVKWSYLMFCNFICLGVKYFYQDLRQQICSLHAVGFISNLRKA